MNQLYVRGKQNAINITTSTQKFNALSSIIRVNSRQLFVFRLRNYKEIETMVEELSAYLKEQKIQHHRTRAHANFGERAIRTFKDMLYKRVEADEKKGKSNIQSTDYIHETLLTYNNQMIHSATKFTPKEARKQSNELTVRLNIASSGKRNRMYPDLDKGDEVKIFRKRKPNEKERVGNFRKNVYTVERIEKKLSRSHYYVEGMHRPYLRFELLTM